MDIIAMAIAKALAKEYTDSRIIDIQSGGTGGISYYICSSSEYNSSKVPTVSNPDTNTIYITPTADGANGMFNLYNYKAHAWNLIKSVELEVSDVQVDNTLTVQGKAADAKAVGDELATVKDALSDLSVETDKTLSITDKPADAKAVGDALNEFDEIINGEESTTELATINGLNFAENGVKYVSNGSYATLYIPAIVGNIYTIEVNNTANANKFEPRYSFATELPANNIAGQYLDKQSVPARGTNSYSHTVPI